MRSNLLRRHALKRRLARWRWMAEEMWLEHAGRYSYAHCLRCMKHKMRTQKSLDTSCYP